MPDSNVKINCNMSESSGRHDDVGSVAGGTNGSLGGVLPSKLNFDDTDNEELKDKMKAILKVLSKSSVNRKKLIDAALSDGGLIDDNIRKNAWPLILGLTDLSSPPMPSEEELSSHPEHQQVVLDVNRSLRRFPPGIPLETRLSLQDQLTRLILRVIISHPRLRYYQGYHDVAVTLLLVTGENAAFFLLEHLSMTHLKDCMEPTMEKTSYLLNYIYPLIRHKNEKVYDYLEKAGVGTMFALPWFLTWFGHSLNHYKDVVRLYDYFLASEPFAPLYLSAVIVAHRATEILQTPCDMASLHFLLSRIPDDLPFDALLKETTALYKKYPPEKIKNEVQKRIDEELRQRQMEVALRQQRMARSASFMWRWLHRIDPVRRIPFLGLPEAYIPRSLRRYRVIMATAVAFGVCAYYMKAVEAFGPS